MLRSSQSNSKAENPTSRTVRQASKFSLTPFRSLPAARAGRPAVCTQPARPDSNLIQKHPHRHAQDNV